MKKPVNIRPAVVLAFAIGAGAGFSYLSAYNSFPYWWLIAIVPAAAAALIFFIIRHNVAGIVFSVLGAALFAYGALGVYFKLEQHSATSLTDGASYSVGGVVTEKSFTQSGEYIKIDDIIAEGERVEGLMIVYLDENYGQFCDVGYNVSFDCTVYTDVPFAYGGGNSSRLLEDVRYMAYPSGKLSSEYGFSLFGSINSAVRSLYYENLPRDTAAIAYAMFTGNIEYIETSTMDTFRYGGVAHVFAVSGMHIVLVYGFVSFILKKMRLGRIPVALLSVALVFFYTGICGFTLSAVRAAIMCAVAEAVKLSAGKYDMLSSLGLSFVAVLLVNPLNVISVGFQLSVAAVAGIALFCKNITRALQKIKVPRSIASAAAMTISSQIATFPILISCFGYVSWASLVLNIVFVPLLSGIFTIQFAVTLVAFIVSPAASVLFAVFAVPLEAVTSFIVVAHAERALISGFDFGVFALPYFLAAYILSGHVNMRVRFRLLAVAALAAVIAAGMAFKNYVPAGGVRITASSYYGGSYAVLISSPQGSVLVISEEPSSYDISSMLSARGTEPDALVILGGDESASACIRSGVDCGDVYVYFANYAIQPYPGRTLHYERQFTVAGMDFTYIDGYDVLVNAAGISIGISCGEEVGIESCDLLFAASPAGGASFGTCVYFEESVFGYNLYDCGDLQFIAEDGKIFSSGNTRRKGVLVPA